MHYSHTNTPNFAIGQLRLDAVLFLSIHFALQIVPGQSLASIGRAGKAINQLYMLVPHGAI